MHMLNYGFLFFASVSFFALKILFLLRKNNPITISVLRTAEYPYSLVNYLLDSGQFGSD